MCNPDNGVAAAGKKKVKAKKPWEDSFEIQKGPNYASIPQLSSTVHFTTGCAIGFATLLFSLNFPFWMAPWAANRTYIIAKYMYEEDLSLFDNSVWTYGTDYALVVAMAFLISKIYAHKGLRLYSCLLLGLYALSVFAGGWAHQFYLSTVDQNSKSFRIWWTVCVGSVCLASYIMGLCGSMLARQTGLPVVRDEFWLGFGLLQFTACALGHLSYQRPACDIFIAGTTQFPSTFYIVLVMWFASSQRINYHKLCGYIGFLWNAPLLPMYPLLVQYTDWSLASVNTLLHAWLWVGWTLQGLSLNYFCRLLEGERVRSK